MANNYKIQQIIDNGTYVKLPFVHSSGATPTFSAVTASNGFIGDGSQLTNLATNSGLTSTFVHISGDTMTGALIINDTLTVTGNTTVHSDIIPETDITSSIGTPIKRFREVNTYSGTTTVWKAVQRMESPIVSASTLDLGLDSSGNTRQITADSSIIQDDILRGGNY